MKSIVDRLWESASESLFVTKDEFLQSLIGWIITPVEIGGELAFAFLRKGPLFHFHSFGTRRAMTRPIFREYIQNIIDEHGYAETRTPKEYIRQLRFNRLIGFEIVDEDEYDFHCRVQTLRHAG